jgi:hypothetical protein
MNWVITVYIALLFFVLTPGVLVTLPPKGKKFTVAAFHAVVFALVWHFTHKLVWSTSMSLMAPSKEGYGNATPVTDMTGASATTSTTTGQKAQKAGAVPPPLTA